VNDAPSNVCLTEPARSTFALVDLLSGRVHPLLPGPNSIGRSIKNRVVLDDRAVSRRHAVLMVHEAGECEVGDADSRSGVVLNGRQVQGIIRVTPGDVLQICGFRLLFTQNPANNPTPFSFTDETLGAVVWNASGSCWSFGLTLGLYRFVPAQYRPSNDTPPNCVPLPSAPEWGVVRAWCRQVRDREAEARALVLRENPLGMHTLPCLLQILFATTTATLIYGEPRTGAVCVTLNRARTFVSGLMWIPSGPNDDS
jgi:hypothetical protein